MFGALGNTARLQWTLRRDYVILGGFAGLFMVSDHLLIRRTEATLRSLGLVHGGNQMRELSSHQRYLENKQ